MQLLLGILGTQFPGDAALIQAIGNLGAALEKAEVDGLTSTVVVTLQNPDGKGTAFVLKNGTLIEEPIQMGLAAKEALEKTIKCVNGLVRAQMVEQPYL